MAEMHWTERYAQRYNLFSPRSMPSHWVVEDKITGELWIVPGIANGWDRRGPYRAPRFYLQDADLAPSYCFIGLGIPLPEIEQLV